MQHRKSVIALAVGLVVVGSYFWLSRPKPHPIKVVAVGEGEVIASVVNTRAGTIKSCQRAGLALESGGIVDKLHVAAGDKVEAGQKLLELRNEDRRAELARIEALQAQNQLVREQRCVDAAYYAKEFQRQNTLYQKKMATDADTQQARTKAVTFNLACKVAEKQLLLDQAQLDLARIRLEQSILKAPFAGIVAEVNSKLGEYMTPSPPGITMPPVIDLIDDNCLYISAPIDEVDAARLRIGQSANVLLDAVSGRSFPAKVRRIAPYIQELEKQARTVEVEAELIKRPTDIQLLIGYSADLEIEIARATKTLRIPASARAADGSVLRVKGDKLERLTPEYGLENWNWVEVKSGLTLKDQLVNQPNALEYKQGDAVTVVADEAEQ